METMNWKAITIAVFCVFLTTACSKKLMPLEIETSGSVSEGTEFRDSSSSDSAFADSGDSGGSGDSGFFSEEPILEYGSPSGGFSSESSGNGLSGSSGSNPFASGGQGQDMGRWNPDSSGSTGLSMQESRLQSGGFSSESSGNGLSGSSGSNPFASGGQGQDMGQWNPDSSGSTGSSMQESRLQSFRASSDLKDIYFKFDRYDLNSNSKMILQKNATFLKSNPNVHVEVQGHCDERGTNNYNIALGERRAHSTRNYLVSQGVDSRNVHVISYGEEKPFCFDSGETCWDQNRRAHFMVSK